MNSPTSPHEPNGGMAGSTQLADLRQVDERELERLIDGLVDNELAEPIRRALLSELDRRPQGWRRCALAFLEAQAWLSGTGLSAQSQKGCEEAEDLFAGIFSDDVPHRAPTLVPETRNRVARVRIAGLNHNRDSQQPAARIKYFELSPQRPASDKQDRTDRTTTQNQAESTAVSTLNSRLLSALRSPGGLVSAMAACFLLAFTLGLVFSGGKGPSDPTAQTNGQNSSLQGQLASNTQNPAAGTSQQGGAQSAGNTQSSGNIIDNGAASLASDDSISGNGTWGTVSLASNASDPQSPPLELPVVDGPSMTDWLSTLPPPVDSRTLAELRRTGHEVITETKWVTVQLEDGRFAVVPVDEVQVRYVGGNNVQ